MYDMVGKAPSLTELENGSKLCFNPPWNLIGCRELILTSFQAKLQSKV